ncbi:hypothetical protein KQI65_09795 [bacterium]|nr:hypothetical protein [bacterium]
MTMPTIQAFQKKLATGYLDQLDYHPTYLHGNPLQPVVPVQTATDGVMIIGAYPTAKFATIGRERDVPVADIDAPFSTQKYFDGAQVRDVRAGTELQEHYLNRLGLGLKDLWLTNLVKVFLFKPGHVAKYKALGKKVEESRSKFASFAEKSHPLLKIELEVARPKAVILLGEEVTKLLCGVGSTAAKQMFDGHPREIDIEGTKQTVFCLPHPGIVMRASSKQKSGRKNKWAAVLAELLPGMKMRLKKLG